MPVEIVMPRLGWDMEEGTLVEWIKHDGDPVEPGDILFTVESEKALMEVEAFDSGILSIPPHSPPSGMSVSVGTILAYLVQPGETVPLIAAKTHIASAANDTATIGSPVATSVPSTAIDPGREIRRTRISPRARRVARELGIDPSVIKGTGRSGRIRERDIRAAVQTGTKRSERSRGPEAIRRIIAQRMSESAHTTASVTLFTEADATELVAIRTRLQNGPGVRVPTYTDFILKASSVALRENPHLNAHWKDNGLVLIDSIDIGLAVDTEGGLLVPVLRDLQNKDLPQIARESHELIARAHSGQLKPDEMRGGTFTITNLGMYGIDAFTPIIKIPQVAILGVGRIITKPGVHNGQIVAREKMTLSMTFDHRAIDGGPAARFLKMIREYVEAPSVWP